MRELMSGMPVRNSALFYIVRQMVAGSPYFDLGNLTDGIHPTFTHLLL